MIVATAGHVDHGKTTLVRALTGIDTDRQPEASQRGMTLDLGFAHADLGSASAPARLSFVDVPGHERFVRNMLAGVAAIDLALLVVAADDGAMPQTHEHLAILHLLGVPRLVVALSKADRVTPQRLAQAQAGVRSLLAGGPFADAPVFALATPSGQGLPALRQHLAMLATDLATSLARRAPAGLFRLAIDRSFLRSGAGRVVTGTVWSGQVQVGDALLLSPCGQPPRSLPLRVRGLQALGQAVPQVVAGQRCAVNLAGDSLKHAEPQRGDWLLAPEAPAPTDRLDVHLHVLASEARALPQRGALQLHLGAASANARLVALDGATLAPGSSGLAQLVLDRPLVAAWGDPFILRDAAARRTLAGGRVLDPTAVARGRNRPERQRQRAALALPDPADALAALAAAAPDGVDLARFHGARLHRASEAAALHARLALHLLPGPAGASGPLGLDGSAWQAWQARVMAAVQGWHADQPDSLGPDDAALRRVLALAPGATAARAVLRATLAALVADGRLLRDGLGHRCPGHQPRLADADQALLLRLQAVLPPAGLRPPIVGELAAALGLPLDELKAAVARLARHGALVLVAPNRPYLPETVLALADQARALAQARPDHRFDAAAYRDHTGIGRNLTIQVLGYLVRAGITRFDGVCHRLIA